jgi:hypothetical protein
LLVTPERIDPDRRPWAAACDRWQAYHGRPEHQVWAAMAVDSARIDNEVLEGERLLVPNALAAQVPGLCRRFNQSRSELAVLVAAASPDRPPLLVGVDPEGLDVKLGGLFHRIPFPRRATDAEDAAGMIESLLRGEGPGQGGGR